MLSNSCEIINGVGDSLSKKLSKCGIQTLQDLLFHLPFRYQDRTHITAIQDLRASEWAVISGRIIKTQVKYGRRPILECYVEDKTGVMVLRFFNFHKQQLLRMNQFTFIRAFGEIRAFAGMPEMIHPEYQLMDVETDYTLEETLTPIYSTTQGLSQQKLRQLVAAAFSICEAALDQLEWMSDEQLRFYKFPDIAEALQVLHQPPPDISLKALEQGQHPALKRLAFDELLAQRLSLQFARASRERLRGPAMTQVSERCQRFIQSLPFTLTNAQQRVWLEIEKNLQEDKPMLRLVQGDVGCGKTVIAALAALSAIDNGYQVAFMAPTDILSEQHTINLEQWLNPLGIKIYRLSGKMKTKERKETLAALEQGECQLLIGTHALFQNQVHFQHLGLVIIDEQHRFGVEQRLMLQQKGHKEDIIPHQLLMTATPIPRTLSMSHFAHLDISVIDELPPGRTPIQTAVMSQARREPIIERLNQVIAQGLQAYWVCTLIEESEKLQCIAATKTAEHLQEKLSCAKVALIHGRMKTQEKDDIMAAFKAGDIDLLVATTVIEVGVDVPNASLMIIENAERLGLSQLHQLRGRVGRGSQASHCLLLYQAPLSQQGSERLKIMRATTDGFLISEKDLQLRGAGEILGQRQTGYRQFKIADLQRDKELFNLLPPLAKQLSEQNLTLAKQITERWLGQFEQYLQG